MLDRVKAAIGGWISSQQDAKQSRASLKGYASALGNMLMDMQLSPSELASLQAQQRSLKLDHSEVKRVHINAMRHVSDVVLSDGMVTEQELYALEHLLRGLGISWADLPPTHLQTYQTAHVCMNIQKGQLPVVPSSVSLLREAPSEVVHAEVRCVLLEERVIRREYVGGSRGASVRICKGVTYRFGSTRGHSVPVTDILPVDGGLLSVTNQRVVFAGSKKSFSTDWSKVLSAEPYADGVLMAFQSRTKSAMLKYDDMSQAEIVTAILTYYMR